MDINLNCNQVESLIKFYIEGKLAPSLNKSVKEHLEKCQRCAKKIKKLHDTSFVSEENYDDIKQSFDKEFHNNLSAYVDNELDTVQNVKIKKIAISNPAARKELESIYKYQKLLHSAYEKTKNNTRVDYSKNIMAIINKPEIYATTYFRNIFILSMLLIIAIICCLFCLYS